MFSHHNSDNTCLKTATSIQSKNGVMDPFEDLPVEANQYEMCWSVPRAMGRGAFRKVVFQAGFAMYIMDCTFNECPIVKAAASPSVFCLRFNLSGQNIVNIPGLNKSFSTTTQTNNLYYFKNPRTTGKLPKGERLRGVSIHFDPSIFSSLLSDSYVGISEDLQMVVQDNDIPYFCHASATTPNMQITIHQIMTCPYRGMTRKVFLESKALELVSYKLEQMETDGQMPISRVNYKADDLRRIRQACEVLICNMEKPPSLSDLGKAVGLSRTKLHIGFSQVYGITPFAYLRQVRLNKAKLYLDQGAMNVTEAAMVVGYSSLSHFAKAFKEQFGIAPSQYMNRQYTVR